MTPFDAPGSSSAGLSYASDVHLHEVVGSLLLLVGLLALPVGFALLVAGNVGNRHSLRLWGKRTLIVGVIAWVPLVAFLFYALVVVGP